VAALRDGRPGLLTRGGPGGDDEGEDDDERDDRLHDCAPLTGRATLKNSSTRVRAPAIARGDDAVGSKPRSPRRLMTTSAVSVEPSGITASTRSTGCQARSAASHSPKSDAEDLTTPPRPKGKPM